MVISKKAQLPNAKKLRQNLNLTEKELKLAFTLPHRVVFEPYEPLNLTFQYKMLNLIIYTNKKLLKIGHCEHDRCTFCDKEPETLPKKIKTWKLSIRNGLKTFHSNLGCFSHSLFFSFASVMFTIIVLVYVCNLYLKYNKKYN